jgi:hypothetical protein
MLAPNEHEAERKRIIKGRNRAVALLLLGMVALFYAITIVQFG